MGDNTSALKKDGMSLPVSNKSIENLQAIFEISGRAARAKNLVDFMASSFSERLQNFRYFIVPRSPQEAFSRGAGNPRPRTSEMTASSCAVILK